MQQIITAKLKLLATPEQHRLLRQTQLAYRDALNFVSRYAFEHGKLSSDTRLHKETYYESNTARLSAQPGSGMISPTSNTTCWFRWNWTCLTQHLKPCPKS